MQRKMAELLADPAAAATLAQHGRATILARHTCRHRVDELMGIVAELNGANALAPEHIGETT
jgi:spore maturation protein CgeB